jgi:hypothetical protein
MQPPDQPPTKWQYLDELKSLLTHAMTHEPLAVLGSLQLTVHKLRALLETEESRPQEPPDAKGSKRKRGPSHDDRQEEKRQEKAAKKARKKARIEAQLQEKRLHQSLKDRWMAQQRRYWLKRAKPATKTKQDGPDQKGVKPKQDQPNSSCDNASSASSSSSESESEDEEEDAVDACAECGERDKDEVCAQCDKPVCHDCSEGDGEHDRRWTCYGETWMCPECWGDAMSLALGHTIRYVQTKNGGMAKLTLT